MSPHDLSQAVSFYLRHPISAAQILARLKASRGSLDGLRPEDLFDHDQDHYGGLAANDALAAAANMTAGAEVADFCAGLGGPARYYAHKFGVKVTGIELTPTRCDGANELSGLVGLADRVRILSGNVMAAPLADASMDAVVSQEAFLHIPDKPRVLSEAYRILRPGRRLAFTDWLAHREMSAADAELMWQGMATQSLQSIDQYKSKLRYAGFNVIAAEDLSAEWVPILVDRFAMYQKLRKETEEAGTPAGFDAFYLSYKLLVKLVQDGTLGGARFTAEKPE